MHVYMYDFNRLNPFYPQKSLYFAPFLFKYIAGCEVMELRAQPHRRWCNSTATGLIPVPLVYSACANNVMRL